MMDTFSLEEDDASELFITQESRNIVSLFPNFDGKSGNIGNGTGDGDRNNKNACQYSDISDDEIIDIPSSQAVSGDKIER